MILVSYKGKFQLEETNTKNIRSKKNNMHKVGMGKCRHMWKMWSCCYVEYKSMRKSLLDMKLESWNSGMMIFRRWLGSHFIQTHEFKFHLMLIISKFTLLFLPYPNFQTLSKNPFHNHLHLDVLKGFFNLPCSFISHSYLG